MSEFDRVFNEYAGMFSDSEEFEDCFRGCPYTKGFPKCRTVDSFIGVVYLHFC